MYSQVPTNFMFSGRQIEEIKQQLFPPSSPLDMRMIISPVTGVYKHSGPHIFRQYHITFPFPFPRIIREAAQTV